MVIDYMILYDMICNCVNMCIFMCHTWPRHHLLSPMQGTLVSFKDKPVDLEVLPPLEGFDGMVLPPQRDSLGSVDMGWLFRGDITGFSCVVSPQSVLNICWDYMLGLPCEFPGFLFRKSVTTILQMSRNCPCCKATNLPG